MLRMPTYYPLVGTSPYGPRMGTGLDMVLWALHGDRTGLDQRHNHLNKGPQVFTIQMSAHLIRWSSAFQWVPKLDIGPIKEVTIL